MRIYFISSAAQGGNMARFEIFLFLALVTVVSTYQAPNWNSPFFIFNQYDSNKDGELEFRELFDMFRSFSKVRKVLMTYDEDMSGTLDRFEFAKAFPIYQNGNLMEMFG